MSYKAPVKDMLFNIEHLARIDQIAQMPGFEAAGQVFEEAGIAHITMRRTLS